MDINEKRMTKIWNGYEIGELRKYCVCDVCTYIAKWQRACGKIHKTMMELGMGYIETAPQEKMWESNNGLVEWEM